MLSKSIHLPMSFRSSKVPDQSYRLSGGMTQITLSPLASNLSIAPSFCQPLLLLLPSANNQTTFTLPQPTTINTSSIHSLISQRLLNSQRDLLLRAAANFDSAYLIVTFSRVSRNTASFQTTVAIHPRYRILRVSQPSPSRSRRRSTCYRSNLLLVLLILTVRATLSLLFTSPHKKPHLQQNGHETRSIS